MIHQLYPCQYSLVNSNTYNKGIKLPPIVYDECMQRYASLPGYDASPFEL